ncbi:hypothetical protein KXR64_22745 [Brucella intermedia]|uniref:hypothetical protein n=1 Tax=Brucella TaxID=234 RepID=UPI001115169B|nr:hypothetical protein [Brucella intermedia]
MKRIAPEHTHDQLVQTEVAHEILNTARGIVISRYYEVENSDLELASRLLLKSKEIHDLKLSFGVTDDETIASIIAEWREFIEDPERFIRDL